MRRALASLRPHSAAKSTQAHAVLVPRYEGARGTRHLGCPSPPTTSRVPLLGAEWGVACGMTVSTAKEAPGTDDPSREG